MSTTEKRIELLNRTTEAAESLKYVLHGYTYILGHKDFDKAFEEELLLKFEESLDALHRMSSILTDAVNELTMRLD